MLVFDSSRALEVNSPDSLLSLFYYPWCVTDLSSVCVKEVIPDCHLCIEEQSPPGSQDLPLSPSGFV